MRGEMIANREWILLSRFTAKSYLNTDEGEKARRRKTDIQ
jgi:hypothetical protein